ncbi:MAG: MalY/PatB family protein [Pleomorphochaeta sp.]
MKYDFDNLANRKDTACIKWNKKFLNMFCGNEEATPYWVADMEYKAAPEITEAAKNLVNYETYGYSAYSDIKQIFMNFAKKRHNLNLKESQISFCQGVLNALASMLNIVCEKKDKVIVPFPAYKPFVNIVNANGYEVLPWKLIRTKDSFEFDFSTFENLCKEAKVFILCSPHNPSSKVYSKETLSKICDIANKYDVFVISDEIHADLVFKNKEFTSFIEVAKEKNTKTMVAMAPSKTFNIAGEFFSVSLFNDLELKKKFDDYREALHCSSSPYFSTTIAREAYLKGYPWLMEAIEVLERNARHIEKYMEQNIKFIKPIKAEASFICFWDCNELLPYIEKDAKDNPSLYNINKSSQTGIASMFFANRAGICLNDGTWFGDEEYKGYVRFNYGTSLSDIDSALLKIKNAVENLVNQYSNK